MSDFGTIRLLAGHGESVRKPPAVAGWVALAAAAVVAWAAVRAVAPELEAGGPVAEGAFSTERAFADVEVLARSPRPLGTAAHRSVRDHVAARLRELGLSVEIQEATVVRPLAAGNGLVAARVHNVVGRRAGAGGAGRLTLASHYDSQPQTFGAGDAASGVATILETLRALGADWRPRPDLEVVLTDGEELGLLGARAFMEKRREVEGADVLLNFEARGQAGPVAMFETSTGNLGLLRLFGRVASRPFASSVSSEVYRRMPNDTDFTIFRQGGVQGLNFAFIAGHPAYHSRLDTAARLSRATLEQEGVDALALVRALGAGEAPEEADADAVYFNPWGTAFLVYPSAWAAPVCLAILAAVGALLVVLRLRLRARWGGSIGAGALWVLGLAAASAVGWLFDRVLHGVPGLLRSPHAEPYDFRALVAVLALLVAAALVAVWALRGRAIGASEALAGSFLFWSVLLVVLTWSAPGASYLAAWPIGFLGLATVLLSVLPPDDPVVVLVLGVAAWPGLAVWAPLLDLVFQALGFGAAALLAPLLALAWSLLALPLWAMAGRRGGRAAAALLAVALACAGALVLRDEPSADRPAVDTLAWLQEPDGAARWFSLDAAPGEWTGRFVAQRSELSPALGRGGEALTGPAPRLELPSPEVGVEVDEVRAGRRHLVLRWRSRRGAPVLRALLRPSAPIASLRIDGRPVSGEEIPAGDLRLVAHGFGPAGIAIDVELEGPARLEVELVDQSYGLPEELLETARPEDRIPAPGWLTDSTFVSARRRL